jgi:hypothetical protein
MGTMTPAAATACFWAYRELYYMFNDETYLYFIRTLYVPRSKHHLGYENRSFNVM